MAIGTKRNRLLPWIIGIVIIAVADVYVAVQMFNGACQAPAIAQFLALVVMPVVYLALMYFTLTSEE